MLSPKIYIFIALLLPYLAYAGDDDDDDDDDDKDSDDKPAAITAAFTDPLSNITFQRFFGAKSQFAFGIALPETPTTDFIGQMTFPTPSGAGWGGIALQGDMVGPLLFAAWPNGEKVVSTFRLAANEDDSPPVLPGSFSVKEISQGTKVNSTHMQYTFLCQNCLDAKLGFTAADTAGNFEMGWALASKSVTNKADPATVMPFHDSGFDTFDAQLSLAKSPEFATWAALAGATSGGNTAPVAAAPAVPATPVATTLVSVASPAPAAKTSSSKKGAETKKGKDKEEDDD